MFQSQSFAALIQGVLLVIGAFLLSLMGMALLSVINTNAEAMGVDSAAYTMPTALFVIAGLCALASIWRFWRAHWYTKYIDGEADEIESYSEEDIALQERLRAESEALDTS